MSWLISNALMKAYENSRCLPEPGEEYSAATSSGGEPSVQLNGSPTQLAYLPPDRMTAFLRPARSGMTFKPLTGGLGAAVLMWCQEVSRAKTSVSPENRQAVVMMQLSPPKLSLSAAGLDGAIGVADVDVAADAAAVVVAAGDDGGVVVFAGCWCCGCGGCR